MNFMGSYNLQQVLMVEKAETTLGFAYDETLSRVVERIEGLQAI